MRLYRSARPLLALALGLLPIALEVGAQATPPDLLTTQGRLTNASGVPENGARDMVFRFYDASGGGNQILVDSHTAGGGNAVTVTNGIYETQLGGGTVTDGTGAGSYTTLGAMFRDYPSVWMSVQVAADAEMTPRTRIVGAAYALNALNLNGYASTNYVRVTGAGTSGQALVSAGTWPATWGTLGPGGGGTGTTTAFTAGSVVFAGAGGNYAQDNPNFFWDDTNNRLGVGKTAPYESIDVAGRINANSDGSNEDPVGFGAIAASSGPVGGSWGTLGTISAICWSNGNYCYHGWSGPGTSAGGLLIELSGTGDAIMVNDGGSTSFVVRDGGNVGVGISPSTRFHVSGGSGRFDSDLSCGGANLGIYATQLSATGGNLHVQGNEDAAGQPVGTRTRMRVGNAWGYPGLYAENNSNATSQDLILGAVTGRVRIGPTDVAGGQHLSVSGYGTVRHSTTGSAGQMSGWDPPSGGPGVWLESNFSEGGGFYADGDVAVIVSPGDPDLLLIYDEDGLPGGSPALTLNGSASLLLTNSLAIDGNTVIDDGGGWHRSYGATGWYNGTYDGGWWMQDATWIRNYASKGVLISAANGNRALYAETSGLADAIQAVFTSSGNGYGGLVVSDLWQGDTVRINTDNGWKIVGSGAVSQIIPTRDYGTRVFFAPEYTEEWLGDSGSGRLDGGRTRIELDPVYLECTTIDDAHPYQVHVTPTSACDGVYVIKEATGFLVVETGEGRSEATFDWEVRAKSAWTENAEKRLTRDTLLTETSRSTGGLGRWLQYFRTTRGMRAEDYPKGDVAPRTPSPGLSGTDRDP